jgi:hypothetical protein
MDVSTLYVLMVVRQVNTEKQKTYKTEKTDLIGTPVMTMVALASGRPSCDCFNCLVLSYFPRLKTFNSGLVGFDWAYLCKCALLSDHWT